MSKNSSIKNLTQGLKQALEKKLREERKPRKRSGIIPTQVHSDKKRYSRKKKHKDPQGEKN